MEAIAGVWRHESGTLMGRFWGTTFRFVRKKASDNRQLNPDSSLKQDVNRYGSVVFILSARIGANGG